jgi:hypothetical protein
MKNWPFSGRKKGRLLTSGGQKMTRLFFDDATVGFVLTRSIELA